MPRRPSGHRRPTRPARTGRNSGYRLHSPQTFTYRNPQASPAPPASPSAIRAAWRRIGKLFGAEPTKLGTPKNSWHFSSDCSQPCPAGPPGVPGYKGKRGPKGNNVRYRNPATVTRVQSGHARRAGARRIGRPAGRHRHRWGPGHAGEHGGAGQER